MKLPICTADVVTLLVIALASVAFSIIARYRWRTPAAIVAAGGFTFGYGLLTTVFSALHLVTAARPFLGRNTESAAVFIYDFRFYSLMLLGILFVILGSACLRLATGVAQGKFLARQRALGYTVMLLLVNFPLMPLEVSGIVLSLGALVNILALSVSREHFVQCRRATPRMESLATGAAGS